MEIKCNTTELKNMVKTVSKAGKNEDYFIIFESKENDTLYATVRGYTNTIETHINAEVTENEICVIPGEKFQNVIAKLNAHETYILVDEKEAKIKNGSSVIKLPIKSNLELKSKEAIDAAAKIETKIFFVTSDKLQNVLQAVHTAVATDGIRPALKGVFFNINGNSLEVAATNAIRLAIAYEKIDSSEKTTFTLPIETINTLLGLLKKSEDVLIESHGENLSKVYFSFGNIKIYSSLLYGDFLDYNKLFNEPITKVIVSTKKLKESISLALTVSDTNAICFDVKNKKIGIYCNSSTGKFHEDIDIEKDGNDIKIHFMPKLLLSAITPIRSDSMELSFTTNKSGCVITADNQKHLVLPVSTHD